MKFFSFPLLAILGIAVVSQNALCAIDLPTFEYILKMLITQEFLLKNQIPGVGFSLLLQNENESLAVTSGYGTKDVEKNTSMDESSLFVIASISKSICATLVSRTLSEKFPELGESALDQPIAKLAPGLNFTFSDRARGESMSFRDLLSHRTCLGTSNFGRMVGAFESTEEYIYRSRYIPEICPYRTGYNYNNAMFSVAGELIAKINGNSNYTEMADRFLLNQLMSPSFIDNIVLNVAFLNYLQLGNFLQELGMSSSRPIRKEDDYETLENLSTPYYIKDGEWTRSNPNLIRRASVSLGSGGVITCAKDMLRYLKFQLNLGKIDEEVIVPKSVMQWLRKPSNPFNFNGYASGESGPNGDIAYGLGLNIAILEGKRFVQHGGYWAPYASQLSLYPDIGLAIWTSSNGPGRFSNMDYGALHRYIATDLMDAIGNKSPEEIQQHFKNTMESAEPTRRGKKPKSKKCKQCVHVSADDLPGVYGNPSQGDLLIVLDENDPKGNLRMEYGTWGKAYIREPSPSKFLLEWDSDVVSDFYAVADNLPDVYLNFVDNDQFWLEGSDYLYTRNATLRTLPNIPWAPDSCVP